MRLLQTTLDSLARRFCRDTDERVFVLVVVVAVAVVVTSSVSGM